MAIFLLTKKTRQTYLKELGFYSGAIDGIEGKLTRAAYLALQKAYFTRESDKDGLYGKNTDILLRNAYLVKQHNKNFKLTEYKCDCGGRYCTGYPVVLSAQLLQNAQATRNKFGAMTITSGMRCVNYNNSLVGSSRTSRHLKGMAIDFYVSKNNTLAGRQTVMSYWRSLPGYNYTYCNVNGSHPNMGNAVHGDVKK